MLTIDIIKLTIFPGLVFAILAGIQLSWLLRKLMARMESRVGPPFSQPLFDIAKLYAKERTYPEGSIKWMMRFLPKLQLFTALAMTLFIPINDRQGLISFKGDLFFFMFLLALHGTTTFFIGWATKNPYALNGAGRALMTEISLEIPLAISLSGMAILTGSMRIADITNNVWSTIFSTSNVYNLLFFIPWFILFATSIYSAIGALEINPFSAAHAETEIVGGWNTDVTGADLANIKLAEVINLFNLNGIIVAVFLGGPVIMNYQWASFLIALIGFLSFLAKLILVLFIFALIATVSSRLRIDQIIGVLWKFFLPACMVGILLILLIQTGW